MDKETIPGYELLEFLGEGRRGVVYKARDSQSGRLVRLKRLYRQPSERSEAFLKLHHPHIASVLRVERAGPHPFAVTEFPSGGTLKSHLQSLREVGDLLPSEQVLSFAGQIANALAYAHSKGAGHGSLKPDNVVFCEDGLPKIVDFDLSAEADSRELQQKDLESLGAMLYELASGRAPQAGMQPPTLADERPDLPPGFDRLLQRLLQSDPAAPLPAAAEVAVELSSLAIRETVARPRLDETEVVSLPAVLARDRVLAGRFRIVRFIARGGMGDVYEAEDLELGEHVALKTVRPEIAVQENAMERFKREIQLARKVTHPNVCRIFDLFRDEGGKEPVTFLTMELLVGETLRHHVDLAKGMAPSEALPIIEQTAAALAAAHKAGIIHRDFKSSNVILVPAADGSNAQRAVVTDFGLARLSVRGDSMATLSHPAELLGTPAYMAPEQLEGGEISAATDIYAFGVVMFEMLTGSLPFSGESALEVALKRLKQPPIPPRKLVPDLDPVWDAVILRCMEKEPARRFAGFDELLLALGGDAQGTAVTARLPRLSQPAPSRRKMYAAGAILILTVLAGWGLLRWRPGFASDGLRRSVAVLGFKNLTGDADAAWLSTALSEMLTTELAAGEKLRTISGENVARMKAELSLPEASSFAADSLAAIRSHIGADVVIYGSYVVLNASPPKVRIDFRVQDAVTSGVLATVSREGYSADLLEIVSNSGAELREKLGVGNLEPAALQAARSTLPATPDAARFYAEGLDKLRVFDAAGAKAALEKAVAADDRFALARAALATSWSMLGYATKAREVSQVALDLSHSLGREDQLLVEGRSRETSLDWRDAAEVYRTLFGFFPDNLDYGLRLAAAQTSAGEGQDALATIEKLRKFPPPDGESPRIDLAEARAAGSLSDFQRQQTLAAKAAAKASSAGAKLLVAGATLIEGNAFANMGDLSRARSAFEKAGQMYSASGDRWDAVNASTNLAFVIMQSGDLDQAETIYQKSLGTYRELGDQKGTAAALASIATVFRGRGDLVKAKELHTQALEIYHEIGDRSGEARTRNNIANILSLSGDQKGAREMYESALPVFREIGDRNALATVLINLGDLVSEEGDLIRAGELYEESRDAFQTLGNKSSLAHALSRLGDFELTQGNLSTARERHQQALSLRKQLGEKGSTGESQLALAQIALHEGETGAAETLATSAAEEFRASNRPDDEASALAVLARTQLMKNQRAESDRAIRRAQELSRNSDDAGVRLTVAITAASIRAAGDPDAALKDLTRIVSDARAAKKIRLELEARLAMAEVEVSAGRLQIAKQQLDALEKEASARGYKYIADRAQATRRKIPAATAFNGFSERHAKSDLQLPRRGRVEWLAERG